MVVYAASPQSSKVMTPPAVHKVFAALADPTRHAVVELLRQKPQRAGELADALGMSAPALSRHLRVLRRNGLIVDDAIDEDARVRLYRLEPTAFISMRDWLTELESFWNDQLGAFSAHVDGTRKRVRR